MQRECAPGAQRGGYAGAPTGFRRLTPSLLQADRAAERFDGLPEGVESHAQLLAAVKAAASPLGLSMRLVHALDWLFRFTRPQDWEQGTRPIVWPSAALQEESLGLSESQVKSINRGLITAGLITMKDSPNGKRYGKRDRAGRIVDAYGFDLSPIVTRYAEFVRVAAMAKVERKQIAELRRRATIARRGIVQILEIVTEYGFGDDEWSRLRHDAQAQITRTERAARLEEITIGVGSLERRHTEARARLENRLQSVETAPKGAEYDPYTTPTKPALYPEQDTVVAHQGSNVPADPDLPTIARPEGQPQTETPRARSETPRARPETPEKTKTAMDPGLTPEAGQGGKPRVAPPAPTDGSTVLRLSTDELTALAPRLRTYLKSPRPAWPEIVDAADWLRGELGVSQSLWGEACIAMGREQAAIAIAIVSAKPETHFRSTPGGYFHGMVAKAQTGELNLARTVWGLRQVAASGSRRGFSHPGNPSCT
jgi:replication initiation protein RepC